ncbi:LuxR family transcriptional regulator [Pseudonocardiaceae bacterium YIM PH 21723]|nr:LuxR family transcriptional regulator [Pseudonocardiaceae bacterium YIM PH 21723]
MTQELLLAATMGARDIELLADVLELDQHTVVGLVRSAVESGRLGPDGIPDPAAAAQLPTGPDLRVQRLCQRLAEAQLRRGGHLRAVATGLSQAGARGAAVASLLESAGHQVLADSPATAAGFFAAATRAGAPEGRLAARHAEAIALSGDLWTALRVAERGLADVADTGMSGVPGLAEDAARGVSVIAAILVHHGQLTAAADRYRWLAGREGLLDGRMLASVPVLLGVGALDDARRASSAKPPFFEPAPTVRQAADELTARGCLESVTGSAGAALSQLTSAAGLLEPIGAGQLMPDSPAALAALVALSHGEPQIAESVLSRAIEVELGGAPGVTRHRVLLAWTSMLAGHAVDRLPSGPLSPRDELFAAAIRLGLARRHGDLNAVAQAWPRAKEALLRHPVDLYTLLPLGEILIGAALLRRQDWVRPRLQQADALLAALGNPPLWAAPLHWARVQAAIIVESPDEAVRHGVELAKAARQVPVHDRHFLTALSAAGRCWLRVLGGEIDQDTVRTVAGQLCAVGLPWDAARLAGQAAIRTPDRRAMSALLDCARTIGGRTLHAVPDDSAQVPAARQGSRSSLVDGKGELSGRELEVAELVLAGLTYKQIGERLFISAKTVEHHVARMRARLGCGSRSELFGQLRLRLTIRSSA